MKQAVPLRINIPDPCKQDWEAMTNAGNGKHCAQCNNVVYDFSQMSDEELVDFFLNSDRMFVDDFTSHN